jgi:nucleoside-diphosphate-sugar epimerase
MTKASILVTGADGNIGSEVISQLLTKRDDLGIIGGARSIGKKKK